MTIEWLSRLTSLGEAWWAWTLPALLWSALLFVLVRSADELLARRVSASWRVALYAVVLLRLAFPAGWETPLGLLPGQAPPAPVELPATEAVSWSTAPAAPLAASVPVAPPAPRIAWTAALPVAHALGALALLAWMLFSRRRLEAELAGAVPAREELAALAPRQRVLEHEAVGPAVAGVLRPRIVVPRALVDLLDRGSLAAVLRHEAAHCERRDPLLQAGVQLVLALLWPVLPLWLAAHRVRQLVEQACDERALDGVEALERKRYGETLLAVAAAGPARVRPALGLLRFGAALRSRLKALRFARRWPGLAQGAVTLALAAIVVAPAGTRPVAATGDGDELASSAPPRLYYEPPVELRGPDGRTETARGSRIAQPGSRLVVPEGAAAAAEGEDGELLRIEGPTTLELERELLLTPGVPEGAASRVQGSRIVLGEGIVRAFGEPVGGGFANLPADARAALQEAVRRGFWAANAAEGDEAASIAIDQADFDADFLRVRARFATKWLLSEVLKALEEDPRFTDVAFDTITEFPSGTEASFRARWAGEPTDPSPQASSRGTGVVAESSLVAEFEALAREHGVAFSRLSPGRRTPAGEYPLAVEGRAESRLVLAGWLEAVRAAWPEAELSLGVVEEPLQGGGPSFQARILWPKVGARDEVSEQAPKVVVDFRIVELLGPSRLDGLNWSRRIREDLTARGAEVPDSIDGQVDRWIEGNEAAGRLRVVSADRLSVEMGQAARILSAAEVPTLDERSQEALVSFESRRLEATVQPHVEDGVVLTSWSVEVDGLIHLSGQERLGRTAFAISSLGTAGLKHLVVFVTPQAVDD